MENSHFKEYTNIRRNLQGVLKVAEILHLRTEEQITKLCKGQEDNEEHDGKASQIFGTTSKC